LNCFPLLIMEITHNLFCICKFGIIHYSMVYILNKIGKIFNCMMCIPNIVFKIKQMKIMAQLGACLKISILGFNKCVCVD
jgi:hypothetical protein